MSHSTAKTMGILLRESQDGFSAELSKPMANKSRLCKQSVYMAIKPYGDRTQFSLCLEGKKIQNLSFKKEVIQKVK